MKTRHTKRHAKTCLSCQHGIPTTTGHLNDGFCCDEVGEIVTDAFLYVCDAFEPMENEKPGTNCTKNNTQPPENTTQTEIVFSKKEKQK